MGPLSVLSGVTEGSLGVLYSEHSMHPGGKAPDRLENQGRKKKT